MLCKVCHVNIILSHQKRKGASGYAQNSIMKYVNDPLLLIWKINKQTTNCNSKKLTQCRDNSVIIQAVCISIVNTLFKTNSTLTFFPDISTTFSLQFFSFVLWLISCVLQFISWVSKLLAYIYLIAISYNSKHKLQYEAPSW